MGTTGYLRFPAIHGDQIVFTAEDDLWRVPVTGGRAERLTAGVAAATGARFSPDGRQIAFASSAEGPEEVYVMPADGGPARRLTYHAGRCQVVGWQPDGSAIIYASAAGLPSPRWRMLFGISPEGGEPVRLPYGVANAIAFGPKGAVVLGRNIREPAFWKRYRGGTAGYLWIDALGDGEFQRLLDINGNISFRQQFLRTDSKSAFQRLLDINGNISSPCWVGERVFFLSDHEGISNVYSCLATGEDIQRHTQQETFYARNLASDGRLCVYHAGGSLFVLDPSTDQVTQLEVELAGSQTQRARQFVPAAKFMDTYALHPKRQAVALTTRGKAFSMGHWDGAVIQHGESDGPRYRLITWLADGQRLVAIKDSGQEPRLAVFSADGSTPERTLEQLDIGHVLELRAAPTGDYVLLSNHRHEVLLIDLAKETLRVLDRSDYGRSDLGGITRDIAWSPDGRWVAYEYALNSQQIIIKLCHIESGETYQVTDPVRHDSKPAFDPAGRYLYFLSTRTFNPVQDAMHFEFSFPKGMLPYLVTLRKDLRSPFTPEPRPTNEEAAEEKPGSKPEDQARLAGPVEIDLEGISSRVVAFPAPEGRYGRVLGAPNGVLFSSLPVEGLRDEGGSGFQGKSNGSLEFYDFEKHKQEHIADEISDFDVSPDGKTLIYFSNDRLRVLKAGEKPPELPGSAAEKPGRESGWLDLERVKVSIRPEVEWRQMFGEAWRLQREQFWVADMGGVDWQGVYTRYAPLVERLASRGELSDLFWEMQGELGSSHAYEGGGEYRQHPEYRQGFLGVDWRFDAEAGVYRVTRLLRGDPWDAKASSPLLAPGVNASVGDAVLAINGQRLTPQQGPQQLLVNQAEQEVQLLLQPTSGGPPRNVTVRALADEFGARYRDWVEGNRQKVHEATKGRVGYVHIPDMWAIGYAEFHRYYLAEYDHDALLVDIRWNSGGAVSGLILEKLARSRIGYDFQRWSPAQPYFPESPRGKLVALTDENAGSDGDIFSHSFKMLGLGPLIGKRTWGGVIGIEPYMPLADGTVTTQPEFSFWFKDVGWGVENYGTDPTIDVDFPPQDYARGADPQLDRAIAEALRLAEEHPSPTPTPEKHPYRGYP